MKKIIVTIILCLTFNISLADEHREIDYYPKNPEQLEELIKKAKDQNDPKIIFWRDVLSSYYYNEVKDLEKSFYWTKLNAEIGDAVSQNNLGHMYDNAIGTNQNKQQAFQWFSKAAEQNQPNALTSIASYYIDGDVVNQSYTKAFEYYSMAAEQKSDRAIYALGLMHEKGLGTPHNYEKAKKLYLEADQLGHRIARKRYDALEGSAFDAFYLAKIFFNGTEIDMGIPIDLSESVFWYKITEYKGLSDDKMEEKFFFKVLKKIKKNNSLGSEDSVWKTTEVTVASDLFEVWKKFSGFDYDKETLKEKTKYQLNHTGTAFHIDNKTLLTNKHVVYQDAKYNNKCDKIIGYDPYTSKYFKYSHFDTKYLNKEGDVEILRLNNKKIKKKNKSNGNLISRVFEILSFEDKVDKLNINISNKTDLKVGEKVFIIGFPKGDRISKYPKISSGLISSNIGVGNNVDEFITDAISYGGSSGSPIFNSEGNLAGILWGGDRTMIDSSSDKNLSLEDPNITYGIKSKYIKDLLEKNNIKFHTSKKWFKKEQDASEIAEKNLKNLRFIECYKLTEKL